MHLLQLPKWFVVIYAPSKKDSSSTLFDEHERCSTQTFALFSSQISFHYSQIIKNLVFSLVDLVTVMCFINNVDYNCCGG